MTATARAAAMSLLAVAWCARGKKPAPPEATMEPPAPGGTDDTMGIDVSVASLPWTGDFDGMVERRRIRCRPRLHGRHEGAGGEAQAKARGVARQ